MQSAFFLRKESLPWIASARKATDKSGAEKKRVSKEEKGSKISEKTETEGFKLP